MTTDRPQGSLYTSINGSVAIVEFGHPASNSFPLELLTRLAKSFEELGKDTSVKVIVLKSEGERAFCAGASLDELVSLDTLQAAEQFFGGFALVLNAIRRCGKIVVGRVQGKVVGGGVGLVAACDYVFATEKASIRLSELSIGIAPLVIAPAVERKTGTAALADLSLAPTVWQNAYWAKNHGLYSHVFDSLKEMDKELDFFVGNLESYSSPALNEWRNVLWSGTSDWEHLLSERALITARLSQSEFTKNKLSKFKK